MGMVPGKKPMLTSRDRLLFEKGEPMILQTMIPAACEMAGMPTVGNMSIRAKPVPGESLWCISISGAGCAERRG